MAALQIAVTMQLIWNEVILLHAKGGADTARNEQNRTLCLFLIVKRLMYSEQQFTAYFLDGLKDWFFSVQLRLNDRRAERTCGTTVETETRAAARLSSGFLAFGLELIWVVRLEFEFGRVSVTRLRSGTDVVAAGVNLKNKQNIYCPPAEWEIMVTRHEKHSCACRAE